MIVVQQEPVTDQVHQEAKLLIQANAKEAGNYPLRSDRWRIQQMPLKLWTVRDDSKLVGYCVHLIADHPIYEQKWASCFSIYVDPAYRQCARRMIQQIEQDLTVLGVHHVTYSCPNLSSFAPFLETQRMGYRCLEIVMEKELCQEAKYMT